MVEEVLSGNRNGERSRAHVKSGLEVEEKISPRKESQSRNSGCFNNTSSLKSGLMKELRQLSRYP
jgi:hypothetical protein